MVFRTEYEIYDALPISNDVLDKGGVELLRAGVVDEELFIAARRVFAEPAHWGWVLADVTRRLATLYAAESDLAESKVIAAIAGAFAKSLRASGTGTPRKPVKRQAAKSARPRVKSRAKPSTKSVVRRKGTRVPS